MADQEDRPKRGRPFTVGTGAATEAEQRFLDVVNAVFAECGYGPTLTEVAERGQWTRQRASQLAKRLEAKGLLHKRPRDVARGVTLYTGPAPEVAS